MSSNDCVRHPSLEDPLPPQLSKESKEMKGDCPEVEEAPTHHPLVSSSVKWRR